MVEARSISAWRVRLGFHAFDMVMEGLSSRDATQRSTPNVFALVSNTNL